ncbi:MAG: hypothetical protein ABI691_16620 [Ginsengibacter sp.]
MAINKNHEFEELNGIKCGIVEKNVIAERVVFLKDLLEYNSYTVISVPSPPPKAVPAPALKPGEEAVPTPPPPPAPETFTVGVTDTTFNPINAIFGRILKTKNGHIVTLAYWQQKESVSHDEIPYYEQNN